MIAISNQIIFLVVQWGREQTAQILRCRKKEAVLEAVLL
jgi:hypothetical protein